LYKQECMVTSSEYGLFSQCIFAIDSFWWDRSAMTNSLFLFFLVCRWYPGWYLRSHIIFALNQSETLQSLKYLILREKKKQRLVMYRVIKIESEGSMSPPLISIWHCTFTDSNCVWHPQCAREATIYSTFIHWWEYS